MSDNTLKDFLILTQKAKDIDLSLDARCDKDENELNKKRIKKLFNIVWQDKFILYFDGRYVMEPYEGLEFKTDEEEFYYNNGNSYLVFEDSEGFKVRFNIKSLKGYKYVEVYAVVKKATEYTKSHPWVSKYKLY